METFHFCFLLWGFSPLETFLRGMETGADGQHRVENSSLETFLRGMETG